MALWPRRRELHPGGGARGGARVQPRGDFHHHREGRPLCICFLPSRAGVFTPRGHKQNSARHTAGNVEFTKSMHTILQVTKKIRVEFTKSMHTILQITKTIRVEFTK